VEGHERRSSPEEITVVDLTGVAAQDNQMARAVFEAAGD
jgi:ornithine cyclodeaminase/alanine dehydrogenase-like protein (mu-crystallin family)